MARPQVLLAAGLGLWAGLLVGCSDELGSRQEVSGTVRLDGQPLDEAAIEFDPLDAAVPEGPNTKSGAPIVQGKYVIPRSHGLAPGKYRIRITAGTPTPGPKPGELPGPTLGLPAKERVPAKYNTESQLEVTVTSSGPNTFDFDIP